MLKKILMQVIDWFKLQWDDLFVLHYEPPIEAEIKFLEGTVITCPKCSKELGVAVRDIYKYSMISSKDWKGEGIEHKCKMICPDDQTSYARFREHGLQIHTDEGWK